MTLIIVFGLLAALGVVQLFLVTEPLQYAITAGQIIVGIVGVVIEVRRRRRENKQPRP